MRVLTLVLGALIVVYWVALLLVAALGFLGVWLLVRPFAHPERRHTPRTRALLDVCPPRPIFKPLEEVRLMPGHEVDVVAEGLGVQARPRSALLPPGHPGDTVTPLAYLGEPEWQLWTSVIAASAR